MFDWLTKRITNNRDVIGPMVLPSEVAMRGSRWKQQTQRELVAKNIGWVYKASSINAENLNSFPLRLFAAKGSSRSSRSVSKHTRRWLGGEYGRTNPGAKVVQFANSMNDDVEEVMEHPVLDLLDAGNPWMSGCAVLEFAHLMRELTGNSYLVPVFDGDIPTELWPLASQDVRVLPDRDGLVEGYIYGRATHVEAKFEADEVMHHKGLLDPNDPYYGMSWLRAVSMSADIDTHSNVHELSVWENDARPNMAVMLKGSTSKEQLKVFKDELNAAHMGSHKSGKTMVFSAEDLSVAPMQFSPREMEYLEGKQNTRDTIMAAAGVPKSLFTNDDVNLASAKVGETIYARNTLVPRLRRWAEDCNRFFLPLFDIEPGEMFLSFDNPVPDDREEIVQETNISVRNGTISRNEARRALGNDPINDEAFDVPRSDQEIQSDFGIGSFDAFDLEEEQDTSDLNAVGEQGNEEDHQDTALNGAQISSLVELAKELANDLLPKDAVREMMSLAFPAVDPAAIDRIVNALDMFESSENGEGGNALDGGPNLAAEPKDRDPLPPDDLSDKTVDFCMSCNEGDAEQKRLEEISLKAVVDEAADEGDTDQSAVNRDDPAEGFVRELARFFVRQRNAITKVVETGKFDKPSDFGMGAVPFDKAVGSEIATKDRDPVPTLPDPWTIELSDIFARRTRGAIKAGVEQAVGDLQRINASVGASFDVVNQGALRFLSKREALLLRSAKDINATTVDKVRREIKRGIASGDSAQGVAKRIAEKINDLTPRRAVNIARTEIASAQVQGRLSGLKASEKEFGITIKKRWLLAPNPCEFCQAIDNKFKGKAIGLDEAFVKGGTTLTGVNGGKMKIKRDVDGPPAHPQCRCDVLTEEEL